MTTTQSFLHHASSYIDMPYMRGGNGDGGIDCSGLVVQASIKTNLSSIPPREARLMYAATVDRAYTPVDGIYTHAQLALIVDRIQPGDLIFREKTEGETREGKLIYHVGIIADPVTNDVGELHIIQAKKPTVKQAYENLDIMRDKSSKKPKFHICPNIWLK